MVDKIYQAVNQFYEGGGTAAATEASAETGEATEGEVTADAASETVETETSETETADTAAPETDQATAGEEVETQLPPEAAGEPAVESESAADIDKVPEKHDEGNA
jgi:hypothetical protein